MPQKRRLEFQTGMHLDHHTDRETWAGSAFEADGHLSAVTQVLTTRGYDKREAARTGRPGGKQK